MHTANDSTEHSVLTSSLSASAMLDGVMPGVLRKPRVRHSLTTPCGSETYRRSLDGGAMSPRRIGVLKHAKNTRTTQHTQHTQHAAEQSVRTRKCFGAKQAQRAHRRPRRHASATNSTESSPNRRQTLFNTRAHQTRGDRTCAMGGKGGVRAAAQAQPHSKGAPTAVLGRLQQFFTAFPTFQRPFPMLNNTLHTMPREKRRQRPTKCLQWPCCR